MAKELVINVIKSGWWLVGEALCGVMNDHLLISRSIFLSNC